MSGAKARRHGIYRHWSEDGTIWCPVTAALIDIDHCTDCGSLVSIEEDGDRLRFECRSTISTMRDDEVVRQVELYRFG